MALLTTMTLAQAQDLGRAYGLDVVVLEPIVHGSVNSNFRVALRSGEAAFFRVCEESDAAAVAQQNALLVHLVGAGVPTPAPLSKRAGGTVAEHAGKPLAVFPFVAGTWSCQASVSPQRLRQLGAALAQIHNAGEGYAEAPRSRFSSQRLWQRLDALELKHVAADVAADVSTLRERLLELQVRPGATETTVIHGDVFRDNVLWRVDDSLAAILDFESASEGDPLFDLMVTLLAWCFGDALERPLAQALLAGYRSRRALSQAALTHCYDEARMAAVRFAITRITDYELRPRGVVSYKDYRRFMARLTAVEAIGRSKFAAWLGA